MKKAVKIAAALAFSAAIAGVATVSNVSAWGDNSGRDGGRESYTIEQINNGALKNKITFNSITDGVIGDERYFVSAREDNGDKGYAGNTWNTGEVIVEEGKSYIVRLYVHNNNPQGKKTVAEDTTVKFALPLKSGNSLEVNGFITSSNASPSEYWDYVTFKTADGRPFYLDYVEGSAWFENNSVAKGGMKVSDNIITKSGILIGYNDLDGMIPGCFEYDGTVSIVVKPVFTDKNYTVQKRVRLSGATEWQESVDAKIGDEVEYEIYYENTTENVVDNVMIKDVLPTNMKIVSDVILFNDTNKNGLKQLGDIVKDGINIGGYDIDGNGWVRFTAKVIDNNLVCGKNILRNWGQVGVGTITLQDSADVVVQKTCEEKKEDNPEKKEDEKKEDKKESKTETKVVKVVETTTVPKTIVETGAAGVASSVLGAGSLVTVIGYYLASRKNH